MASKTSLEILSVMICGHVLWGLQAQGRVFRAGLGQPTLVACLIGQNVGGHGQPTGKAENGLWNTWVTGC